MCLLGFNLSLLYKLLVFLTIDWTDQIKISSDMFFSNFRNSLIYSFSDTASKIRLDQAVTANRVSAYMTTARSCFFDCSKMKKN